MLDILKNTYQRWRKQGHSSFWQVPCYLYVRKKPTSAYKQLRYEYLFDRDEDSTAYSNKSILQPTHKTRLPILIVGAGIVSSQFDTHLPAGGGPWVSDRHHGLGSPRVLSNK